MQANVLWSMDFMADALYGGRRFRTFNVLDEGVREALAIEIDPSLRTERVIRVLEQLKEWRGLPQAIRCDNGPGYTSQVLVDGCETHRIELRYIQPGKPNQNAYIERFNKSYRHEVLDAHLFEDLDQVRQITDVSFANNASGNLLLLNALLDGEGYGSTSVDPDGAPY